MKKIYIRGAGDLATGIACRLYESGFQVLMTDLEVPTTVRRTVAFSPAIYEAKAEVEGKVGVYCSSIEEVEEAFLRKEIPIVVDKDGLFLKALKPDVVVDAIIAKKNVATKINDAEIVIAIGPGFIAGEDCHCVIESMRGHNLGRCIYTGHATPNTGIPGNIGGFTTERIIRAACDGKFRGAVKIGDRIQSGQTVGYIGEIPIVAQIDGMVRGLLQDGVMVHKNMKAGDVDPRAEKGNCYTVSDKSRAIAGGVLEGILHLIYFR
ncbi:selenium-dependent molybdenum cofactor biosynthesis protein YqeB [Aminipila sp.]|uniref:selenium-dependent molybdenum cofactor biosynthesis protein YqeB n=1 Tax=Aminipila sp. TaxID=2060095 RepID=UPI00289C37A3|nr:selenium-dependent molybdenum cofactor biosynthesis protein YqeB [Aminipila sp.]